MRDDAVRRTIASKGAHDGFFELLLIEISGYGEHDFLGTIVRVDILEKSLSADLNDR